MKFIPTICILGGFHAQKSVCFRASEADWPLFKKSTSGLGFQPQKVPICIFCSFSLATVVTQATVIRLISFSTRSHLFRRHTGPVLTIMQTVQCSEDCAVFCFMSPQVSQMWGSQKNFWLALLVKLSPTFKSTVPPLTGCPLKWLRCPTSVYLSKRSWHEDHTPVWTLLKESQQSSEFSHLTLACLSLQSTSTISYASLVRTHLHGNKKRLVSLRPVARALGTAKAEGLLGFYAVSGANTTDQFAGKEKLSCWQALSRMSCGSCCPRAKSVSQPLRHLFVSSMNLEPLRWMSLF